MIPLSQNLPPLTVISNIVPLDQNTANETGSQKSGGQQLKKGEQQFTPGQELTAKVISSDGRGRYVLDADGQRIEVQSRTPLRVGQKVNVLVQQGENGLLLAFKSPEAGQFLTRALATGGSSQALGMIFGRGLAAQAGSGASSGAVAGRTAATIGGTAGGGAAREGAGTTGRMPDFSGSFTEGNATVKGEVRLPSPAVIEKMTMLQQEFVQQSAVPRAVAQSEMSAQFAKAVQQFTNELGRQITPLLGQGRTAEAMEQVAAGIRSLAQFFPPQPGGGMPRGLHPQQQQLFQAFSTIQQAAAGMVPPRQGEAALDQVVQRLEGQLTPALAIPGREQAGPPQNPKTMLNSLAHDLLALNSLVRLPAAYHNQPAGASVFRSGLDGLFAFQLSLGAAGRDAALAGLSSLSAAGAGAPNSGVILQQLVQGLGLDMEKLLAKGDVQGAAQGLKFQLLRQMQEGQSVLEQEVQVQKKSKGGEESSLLRQVGEGHQALQSINFLQVLQVNLDRQGMLALPLPLSFLEQGYLLMEDYKEEKDGQRKGGEEDATRFSVLMKLSSLGNVRVDILQTRESVYVRFHTESAEINELFRKSQQELRAGLLPLELKGLSYASEPASDPLATLLQKCEGNQNSSLFRARI